MFYLNRKLKRYYRKKHRLAVRLQSDERTVQKYSSGPSQELLVLESTTKFIKIPTFHTVGSSHSRKLYKLESMKVCLKATFECVKLKSYYYRSLVVWDSFRYCNIIRFSNRVW